MMCADNCVESVQSEVSLLGESNWSGVVFSPTTVWPLWIMMPSRRALARKSLPENSAHEMPVIRGIPRCFRWSRVLTHALVAHVCQHDSVNSPLIMNPVPYIPVLTLLLQKRLRQADRFQIHTFFFHGRVMQTICKMCHWFHTEICLFNKR